MPKATSSIPADRLANYERLVATLPGVERRGAATPYTSVNGHMFSFLTPEGRLALRLPPDARAAFLVEHAARLCVQHGTTLKEYVEVPDALLPRTEELRPLFALSHAHVAALKPKPTTRPRSKSATAGR